jgi:hypothetical protein
MAIKANGALLEWAGYEYAQVIDGEVIRTGTYGELRNVADDELFFRAVYATEWIEMDDK